MNGQPINIFPCRGGGSCDDFNLHPPLLNKWGSKFLIFFIMTADLIPLLNVQMDHLVAIECSSEAVRVDVSCEDLSLKTDLGAMKTVSRHFLDPTKIVLVDS